VHEIEDPPAPPRRDVRLVTVLALVVVLLLLGVATGAAWWAISPLPVFEVLDGRLASPVAEQETAVAADGWFAACAAIGGVLWALAVRRAIPVARIPVLAWLTVAGLAGSVLAWQVGTALGPDALPDSAEGLADGDRVTGPLQLSAYGVLLTWPLTSVIVLFALTAGLDRDRPVRAVSPPVGSPP